MDTVEIPPQQTAGNPLLDNEPNDEEIGIVAVIRLQLTGPVLGSVNGMVESMIPSAFVSQASVAALVTVLPALCSGIPVSSANP